MSYLIFGCIIILFIFIPVIWGMYYVAPARDESASSTSSSNSGGGGCEYDGGGDCGGDGGD